MTFVPGKQGRILVGDFHLSSYATGFETQWMQDMLESSVLTDSSKQFLPDEDGASLSVSGLYDTTAFADLAAFKSTDPQPVTIGLSGFAHSSAVWMVGAIESQFKVGAARRALAKYELSCQPTGLIDFGVSLHDLEAETADENGTSHDGTAATSGGAVAHLHVTAFSGLTDAVVTIEDSANNTDFAVIGTFATVSGVTSERLAIAGTVRRYTRYALNVTGTGSVTFQASLARR